MYKRISAIIVVFVLIFSTLPDYASASEQSDDNIAYAIFNDGVSVQNFKLAESGNSKSPTVVTRLGRKCWLLDKLDGNNHAYINMILADSFKKDLNGSVYTVEVDYYDVPGGYLRLYYDSKVFYNDELNIIYTKGENVWKTASFTIDDALFSGKADGKYDMVMSIKATSTNSSVSGTSIPVGAIRITKHPNANPVYVSSKNDAVGNTFRWYDENKIVNNTYENYTDKKQNLTVVHSMTNDSFYKAYEKEETVVLEPFETKTIPHNLGDLQRCDIYTYSIDIKNKEGTVNSRFEPYHIAILKTDPNGIVNEGVMYAAHLTRYDDDSIEQGSEMLAMSNTYGVRADFAWTTLEKQKGNVTIEGTPFKQLIESFAKHNLKFMPILDYGNQLYTNHYMAMPESEEEVAAWSRYVEYSTEILKDVVDRYEVWNEPNYQNFNHNMVDGAGYYKLFKLTNDIVKSIDLTAKLGGPSITGLQKKEGPEYFNEAVNAGMWKEADAISLHPYTTIPAEKAGLIDTIDYYFTQFKNASDGKIPEIWNTETGYTTPDPSVGSEKVKGALNARASILYSAKKLSDITVFYNFEKKGVIATDREDQFGNVRSGYQDLKYEGKIYSPTISYVIIAGLNYIMAQSEIQEIVCENDNELYINRFWSNKFNKNIVTMYTLENQKTVTLDLETKNITYYDEFGNATELESSDGIFSFTANNVPKYILGDIDSVKVIPENKITYKEHEISIAYNDSFNVDISGNVKDGAKLTFDLPTCMQEKNISEFKAGKASAEFLNMGEIGSQYDINVYIEEEGKRIHTGSIKIKSTEGIVSDFSVELLNPDNVNMWLGKVSVKNNSSLYAQKGYIKFNSPEEFKSLGAIDIGSVSRKRTGEVRFGLPEIFKKGQYTIDYDIVTENEKYNFVKNIDFTIAKYAEDKPTIDGIVEKNEWNMNTLMYVDSSDQLKQMTDWGGVTDLSGRSGIMWDEENFYLFAEVTDDVHANIQGPDRNWNGDNIQFGIYYGDAGFTALGQSTSTFHEISVSLSSLDNSVSAWRFSSQDSCYPSGNIIEQCDLAIKREGNITTYEFKMPWKDLLRPGDEPKSGDKLGFSFLVNEADFDVREGWMEYTGGIGETKNTSLFTYLSLIK